ncbi:hypothetical protein FISHEDRAFT_66313 [Fistulina hepatica ATCC 64428]|uniref:Zinc finger PHD-type domain-containing protein n=1 Tax=Fistulina hepatica ATCC 64428 TaxID=1128425 RepID=A0A0D7AA13_9AGAR|nr:hypothetical protein FISHEDRAFT_66313 [Fistulina hepatica ATCC 64428]
MAQIPAPMGPPLSPNEPRRSGRRSVPAVATSTSKSPDSDQPLPPRPRRPSLTSNTSSSRSRRTTKIEDPDDFPEQPRVVPISSTTTGRGKRKGKEKDPKPTEVATEPPLVSPLDSTADPAADDDEGGVTRCVCDGLGETGEIMIQCEMCKVWQHALCMGLADSPALEDDDYYCELCKPELHTDLLKRGASSNVTARSMHSRSRSPSTHYSKQPTKRRNTMNSRFDDSLQETIQLSAAEAAALDTISVGGDVNTHTADDSDPYPAPSRRKKRRRTDIVHDEELPQKRTRSASTASVERPLQVVLAEEQAPPAPSLPAKTPRNRRGARKATHDTSVPLDVMEDDLPPPTSRRGKGKARRSATHAQQEGGSVRKGSGSNAHNSATSDRGYRNSYYAALQQPLFTSWGLPDYLIHLEEILPTGAPRPLEILAGRQGAGSRGSSVERTVERGVKVKWPSKRMSVVDMNKRVRALVEWVGREQDHALDRKRRRTVLEQALRNEETVSGPGTRDASQVAGPLSTSASVVDGPMVASPTAEGEGKHVARSSALRGPGSIGEQASTTMKMMEELMQELIRFQERFGPGAKGKER